MKKRLFSYVLIVVLLACSSVLNVSAEGLQNDLLRSTFDANYYATNNPDVVAAVGNNPEALYEHYITSGFKEMRGGSAETDIRNMTFIPVFTMSENNDGEMISIYLGVSGGLGVYFDSTGNRPDSLITSTQDYIENVTIYDKNDYDDIGDIKTFPIVDIPFYVINAQKRLESYGVYYEESPQGNMVGAAPLNIMTKYLWFSKDNGKYFQGSLGYEDNKIVENYDINGILTTQYTVSIALNNYDKEKAIFVTKINGDDGYERMDYYILINSWVSLGDGSLDEMVGKPF